MAVHIIENVWSCEPVADQPLIPFQLLKDDRISNRTTVKVAGEDEEALRGIRCPQCGWRPSASSRWYCHGQGTPEPPFPGCGTIWNTFLTRGRCPGCSHQWRWTSCFRCEQWSLHDDWYETTDTRSPT